jgi:hypothetical protein
MKRLVSILLGILLLLSATNLTVATHYCGGKIAATKVSFGGKMATCGMESDKKENPSSTAGIDSNCCENVFSVYTVDNNYAPSECHQKPNVPFVLHNFFLPAGYTCQHNFFLSLHLSNAGPPLDHPASAVYLPGICVFRI